MLAIPATARLSHLRHFSLLVDDRPEVPLRIAGTCLRRRGTVVALAFDARPDRTAPPGSSCPWRSSPSTRSCSSTGSPALVEVGASA